MAAILGPKKQHYVHLISSIVAVIIGIAGYVYLGSDPVTHFHGTFCMAKLVVLPNFLSSVAIGLLNCNLPIFTRHGFIYAMKTTKIVLKGLVFLPDMGYSKKKQSWGNVSM